MKRIIYLTLTALLVVIVLSLSTGTSNAGEKKEFYIEQSEGYNQRFTVTNLIESKIVHGDIGVYIKAQNPSKIYFDFIFSHMEIVHGNKKYGESGKPISSIAKETGKVIVPDGPIIPKHYKSGYGLEFSKPGRYSMEILFSDYSLRLTIDIVDGKLVKPSIAPKDLSATGVTKNQINLKWATVSGAKTYKIYRATSKSGAYKYIGTTSTRAYKNTSLRPGTIYWYKVSAVYSKGEGSLTSAVSGKTKK